MADSYRTRPVSWITAAPKQVERSLISECRAELSAASRRGRTLGRAKKFNGPQIVDASALIDAKTASRKQVASPLRVSPRTFCRALVEEGKC